MTLNKIYTDEEYMAQGFKAWEVPLIRKHDELFNAYQLDKASGTLTEEEREERVNELDALVEILGL